MVNNCCLAFFLLTLIACQNDQSQIENTHEIHNSQSQTITLNLDGQLVHTSELVEELEVVKLLLPEGVQIGQISKFLGADNKIIVMDQVSSRVFCFDRSGNYIFEISAQGAGPGQYRELSDISINRFSDRLEILDRSGQQVLQYSLLDGKFEGADSYLFFTSNYAPLGGNKRLFYNSNIPNGRLDESDKSSWSIYITNTKNEVLSRSFPFKEGLDRIHLVTKWNLFESSSGAGKYNFVPLYDNKIYEIDSSGILLKYEVDFGKYKMPDEFLAGYRGASNEWVKVILDQGYAFDLTNFFESERFITFRCNVKGKGLNTIFDKKSNLAISYDFLQDDLGTSQIYPEGVIDEFFVTPVTQDLFNKKIRGLVSQKGRAKDPRLELLSSYVSDDDPESILLVFTKFKSLSNISN